MEEKQIQIIFRIHYDILKACWCCLFCKNFYDFCFFFSFNTVCVAFTNWLCIFFNRTVTFFMHIYTFAHLPATSLLLLLLLLLFLLIFSFIFLFGSVISLLITNFNWMSTKSLELFTILFSMQHFSISIERKRRRSMNILYWPQVTVLLSFSSAIE